MIKFKQETIIFDSQTIAGLLLMIGGIWQNNIPLSIFGLALYLTNERRYKKHG